MNQSITEYNRQLETLRRNNAKAQKQSNKAIGVFALIVVGSIGAIYILNALNIIHLAI